MPEEACGVFAEELSFGMTFEAIYFSLMAAELLGALPANLGPSSIEGFGIVDFLAAPIRLC
jgi:hypothetical protein